METDLALTLARTLERGFIIVAGMLAIWIGYRLFQSMPNRREGESKIELPGGTSIFLSRVGPGVFFALFGAGMIAYSARPVSYSENTTFADGPVSSVQKTMINATQLERAEVAACDAPCPSLRKVMAQINSDPTIEAGGEAAVQARRKLKLAIIRGSWDSAKWGDYQAFQSWFMAPDGSAAPSAASEAVAILDAMP
jgi:hypothetical protein